MNEKKRVGMIGGGNASFMGEIHRAAIKQCGCLDLVCGAFGSTRQSSFETGKLLQLSTRRAYGTYRDLFRRESSMAQNERVDFVTVLAPNAMHYPIAMSAIDAGISIFGEKPFTCNLDEAVNLTRKQRNTKLKYGVAMVYPNYPALQKARELVQTDKAVGTIRKVISHFQLGWMAQRLETAGNKQAGWRTDPRRSGPAGCLVDLCSHSFYVTEWLTGLSVTELCADLRPSVPGRILDDDCNVLVRFDSGARGILISSQVATGDANGVGIVIYGDKAALHWSQHQPEKLTLIQADGKRECLTCGDPTPETSDTTCFATPYGNNAAYITALAAAYRAFTNDLSPRTQNQPNTQLPGYMTVEEGLRSVAFVDAVMQNTAVPEDPALVAPKWQTLIVPEVHDL